MSRDCCVAIPLSAMGLSVVCDCDTHLLFLGVIHANSDGFGTLVNVNAPAVATTSWWLHFSAEMVA